ncbi:GL26800 [Drosophila persimilis]|uniref:GL26800 n=1 Tax=Drosophila persimilis TaxID=7234 RepID=B4H2F6_DROPE|nr:GL26800 [Drosophila persimilis]
MSFLPGEPVPPGFEEDDSSSRPAIIQKQLDDYTRGPLIGTEYCVELIEEGRLVPNYYCVLCSNYNDVRTLFVHWTSLSHRNKYLQTHFQKAYEVLQKIQKRTPNGGGDLVIATGILCQLIEKHCGRARRIVSVPSSQFSQYRSKFCSQVRDKFHFDEFSGPDFVEEARKLVQDMQQEESSDKIAPKENNSSSVIALDAISSDDESFGPNQKRSPIDEQSPSGRGANRSPPAARELPKQQLPTPKELSMQASIIAQERYKWEKFRCMLELQLKQLRDETETYESFPEKHPDYPDEWKQFWNRRYKELQEEKKTDPNSYDYKPEWISYWKDRRVELFNIAVGKIKKELKEKFKLADEDEEKTKDLMERYKIRVSSPREASAAPSSGPPHVRRKPNFRNNRGGGAPETVIDISDDETPNPSSRNHDLARIHSRRSVALWEEEAVIQGADHAAVRRDATTADTTVRVARIRAALSGDVALVLPVYYHRRPMDHKVLSSNHGRPRDGGGYAERRSGDRERDRERERERTSDADFYRSGSFSRGTGHAAYERMETFRVMDSRVYPEYSLPKKARSKSPDKDTEPPVADDGPLTVVSVLRMLSAVEDHLGSLGPKALSLLSKALAMEMVRPNAAEDLLLNEDNCVFLETTKEKLKGILIAEVLDDPQKVRVVKKLITNIAAIIFQVKEKAKKDGGKSKANPIPPSPAQLPFDRNVVCAKLASALVGKGYYDMSSEDMDRLLHFYATLAKIEKSRRLAGKKFHFSEVLNLLGLTKDKVVTDPIEIDIDELMKEVESHLHKKEKVETVVASKSDPTGMESLTDSDLQTLLQNFKFLSSEEQVHLIGHLRKLEVQEPLRVECLRKYVNLAELSGDGESCSDFLSRVAGTINPENTSSVSAAVAATVSSSKSSLAAAAVATAAALSSLNTHRRSFEREMPAIQGAKQRRVGRSSPEFLIDDDDDDDYNFDDLVMKACDSNGGGGAGGRGGSGLPSVVPVPSSPNALTFKPAAASKFSLDTESIIANLMDTLTKQGGGGGSRGSGSGGNGGQQAHRERENPTGASTPGKSSRAAAKKLQQQQGSNKMGGLNPSPMMQQQQPQQQQAGYNQQDANPAFHMQSHHFGQDPQMHGATTYSGSYSYPGYSNYQGPGQEIPGYGGVPLNPWANNGVVPQPPPYTMQQQQQQQNYTAAQQQHHQQPPHPSQQYNNMFGPRH